MAYTELIKSFERIRDYMREFYVYGFKSRDEYDIKSARSYDNERRRIESYLGEYMGFRQSEKGKNVFLSIDSRSVSHNPLYSVLKSKSFTDGDITLHFILFDILYSPEVNLAVSLRDFRCLNEFEEERVHCWLKLYLLTIATSYVVKEENRIFKSEYIISQSLMMACKKMGYDGIAYYSRRVDDEVFALCAINLALFVDYNGEYSEMIKHMKVDDAFNYSLYKQLDHTLKYKKYELRSTYTEYITNIGSYDRQYPYKETDFYHFDEFLFTTWRDKPKGKGKDEIPWGVEV